MLAVSLAKKIESLAATKMPLKKCVCTQLFLLVKVKTTGYCRL